MDIKTLEKAKALQSKLEKYKRLMTKEFCPTKADRERWRGVVIPYNMFDENKKEILDIFGDKLSEIQKELIEL